MCLFLWLKKMCGMFAEQKLNDSVSVILCPIFTFNIITYIFSMGTENI